MTLREILRLIKNFPKVFFYDYSWTFFQLRYSNLIESQDAQLASLLVVSHVLEKGLTMPQMRLGFGQNRVRLLIGKVKKYINKYDATPVQVQSTLNDLAEYLSIHKLASYKLPEDITDGINALMKYRTSTENTFSLQGTSLDYFTPLVDFEAFAVSRRSLRCYSSVEVEIERVIDAIRIAQSAPSACNRQATRVKIIQSKEAKEYVLGIQNGTRGFGHLANKILLITSDMSNWAPVDRNSAFLDAGIFTMNLLYALHYKKICACPLNADMNSKTFKEIHKVLNIPTSEIPVCFITIGYPTDTFKIAKSERIKVEDIYKII